MRRILDALTTLEAAAPGLPGRLDSSPIVATGHSLGRWTAGNPVDLPATDPQTAWSASNRPPPPRTAPNSLFTPRCVRFPQGSVRWRSRDRTEMPLVRNSYFRPRTLLWLRLMPIRSPGSLS